METVLKTGFQEVEKNMWRTEDFWGGKNTAYDTKMMDTHLFLCPNP